MLVSYLFPIPGAKGMVTRENLILSALITGGIMYFQMTGGKAKKMNQGMDEYLENITGILLAFMGSVFDSIAARY